MDADLRAAARDLLIRYGGDTFPNLFRSARGTIVTDDEGREILVRRELGPANLNLGRPRRRARGENGEQQKYGNVLGWRHHRRS